MTKYIMMAVIALCFACKSPEARRPVSASSGTFIKDSAERNKKLLEQERDLFKQLIQQDTVNDFIVSDNGFWYAYNTKVEADSLKTPKFGDIVNFDYDVRDINGNYIYKKNELKTRNYAMDQQELFTGLREGLKLMKAGETVTFLFPSQKAFGYYGDERKIGTNVPLICEVTVNSIKNKQ